MRWPLLFSLLPEKLKPVLYYRWYNPPPKRFHHLFEAAPLAYAPQIRMELVPGDVSHGSIAFTGFVELSLTRRLACLAKSGGLLIDVGANAGYFSLLWASAGQSNRVIALEASPRNVELLRRNVRRNGLEGRIDIHPYAAGKEPGRLEFDTGPAEQTGWGGFTLKVGANTISVEVLRVDELVPPSTLVEALKVDVEGADTWVLMGCERLLRAKRVRHIFFEQNKPRLRALGIQENDAVEFLESVGYMAIPESDPTSDLVAWLATPK